MTQWEGRTSTVGEDALDAALAAEDLNTRLFICFALF